MKHPFFWYVTGVAFLWAAACNAAGFEVMSAGTTLEAGVYRLNAQMAYYLSKTAQEALQNGVPLNIVIDVEVLRQRPMIWDEPVHKAAQRFRLEYHSLTQQYLVDNINSGQRHGFPSRTSALQFMGTVKDFPLLEQSRLDAHARYKGALRARLDVDALPAPLRPLGYLTSGWRLTSAWFTWPL